MYLVLSQKLKGEGGPWLIDRRRKEFAVEKLKVVRK